MAKNNLVLCVSYLSCMFLFSCWGSEFEQTKITGRYYIRTMDSYHNEINLSYQLESGDFVGLVPAKVQTIGTNGKYIFVKRGNVNAGSKDKTLDYYIVKVLSKTPYIENGVIGPMNEKEFKVKLKALNIQYATFAVVSREVAKYR